MKIQIATIYGVKGNLKTNNNNTHQSISQIKVFINGILKVYYNRL